jgi:metal-responsive CopG/Arc/MetJ family transcriptional regulator
MADTEKDKAWINALIEKDLLKEFDEVVAALDTDRSKLIRNLVRDTVEEFKRKKKQKQRLDAKLHSRPTARMN